MIVAEKAAQRRRDVAAIALPAFSMARALGTMSSGTRRMTIAVDIDQKPPMATPSRARPTISTA